MAMHLALRHPMDIAGLVSIGAFWSNQGQSLRDLGQLDFVLCCGQEDVAHFELEDGRRELKSRGWKALSIRFEGGHEWPPPAVCAEALEALEMGAMERGWIPLDPERKRAFLARRNSAAEAAEAQGENLLAMRLWEDLGGRFADLEARRRASALSRTPGVRQEQDLETVADRLREELTRLRPTRPYGAELGRLHSRLKQAAPAEALMLRRVLVGELLDLRMAAAAAIERKQWARAEAIIAAMVVLDDRQPRHLVTLAGVRFQQGHPDRAMQCLRQALQEGYKDSRRLREHPLLQGLRDHPGFQQLLRDLDPPRALSRVPGGTE